MGHGGLIYAFSLVAFGPFDPSAVARVQTRNFDIAYAVNEAALPLQSVQLWFSRDEGGTWDEYGFDEDRQSPITFQAPAEGAFGFFLIFRNSTGASSDPPSRGTPPQQRVFVDFTPPVVQLHPLRVTSNLGQTTLQVRWTAIDSHLLPRPIELVYRKLPDPAWIPAMTESLANTGRYDWRLPENVSGTIAVKITVGDEGGHRVDSEPQSIDASVMGGESSGPIGGQAAAIPSAPPDEAASAIPGSKRAKEQVSKLVTEATSLRERGELVAGVSRLREAVKLDPKRTDAFNEMAGMLLQLNEPDKALHAYEIVLKQRPNDRDALRGMARVFREKRDLPMAAERLRTLLRYNPTDAEVWIDLGDIAVFQGDEVLARDCYTRATTLDPKATTTVAEAKERLAMMASNSINGKPNPK